jgi:hypothetical protein
MRKIVLLLGILTVVGVGSELSTAILSAQNDEFDAWMDTIDAKNQSVQANIAGKDAKAAADDAKALQDTFKLVEGFWAKRGNAADGVQLSQQAEESAGAVLKAIEAKDFDGAAAQSIAITRTCTACHRLYRPLS